MVIAINQVSPERERDAKIARGLARLCLCCVLLSRQYCRDYCLFTTSVIASFFSLSLAQKGEYIAVGFDSFGSGFMRALDCL